MCVHQHFISVKSLLESRAHERVSGSGVLEDLKVHPEEGQVDNCRNDNQANNTSEEVLVESVLKYC